MDILSEIISVSGNLTLAAFMLWRITKQDNELEMYRSWFIRRQERRDDNDTLNAKTLVAQDK